MQSAEEQNPPEDIGEQASTASAKKSDVGQRWLTSAVAIPIVVLFAWFGGWWTFAAVAAVTFLGVYELHTMLLHAGYHPVVVVSFGLSALILVATMFPQQRPLLFEIGLSAALFITFPLLFRRKKLDGAMVDWSLTLASALYLGWPMSFFILLRGSEVGWPFAATPWWVLPRGVWWLLVVLFGVWGSDTG
ncbi:MAG TPA: phosphatidate cytidylyltransferase, partial [Ktedonobacteraceae bacterium]|nr:phosphatidate cytidylyltransferase [Ktedonobacteraceae bacterium]